METLVLNLLLKNLVVCQNYTWRSNLLLNGPTVGIFFESAVIATEQVRLGVQVINA